MFLDWNAVGVVGVTGKEPLEPLLEPVRRLVAPPEAPKFCGICGGLNSVGYRNSRTTSTLASTPGLVVTLGALMRSTPFFWLRPRITIWNCGSVSTPERAKRPGARLEAAAAVESRPSMLSDWMAAEPVRRPLVRGLVPIVPEPEPGFEKGKSALPPLESVMLPLAPLPTVPPEPKTRLLPGMLNGPRSQSKPSSSVFFWVTSTNLVVTYTCLGVRVLWEST